MTVEPRGALDAAGLWLILWGALLLGAPGCVVRRTIEVTPTSGTPRICADGAPVKILQDPACTNGICGYTCDPTRWKAPAIPR